MWLGLDGKDSVSVFPKVLPAGSPLHGSLVCSHGISDALIKRAVRAGTCVCYSLLGLKEGLLSSICALVQVTWLR